MPGRGRPARSDLAFALKNLLRGNDLQGVAMALAPVAPECGENGCGNTGGIEAGIGKLFFRCAMGNELVRQGERTEPAAAQQVAVGKMLKHVRRETANGTFLHGHKQRVMPCKLLNQLVVEWLAKPGVGNGYGDALCFQNARRCEAGLEPATNAKKCGVNAFAQNDAFAEFDTAS